MQVIVVPYNPKWVQKFETEAKVIQNQIGGIINAIHHIGSTSVPNLMAKPIIDIILDVDDLKALDQQTNKLEQLGYEAMGEYGIVGRRYFRKGGDHRTHHIHAFQSGDPNIMRHLAFRDYLIQHPSIAKAYEALKLEVAEHCNHDMGKYCDGKDAFIKHHETLAIKWFQKIQY